jgi:ribosomal protein RSM22 (predicted rRNA methylase)
MGRVELPADLREALVRITAGVPAGRLADAVDQLVGRYRGGEPPTDAPILADTVDVTAYAAYRMPATYAAVRAALAQVALRRPDLTARTLLDLGGGTGAAAWAVADAYPGLESVTAIDQVPAALALGERLARTAAGPALRTADWRPAGLAGLDRVEADVVTVSYVLGELPAPVRTDVVRTAASSAGTLVLIVEPGTPAGYDRIITARAQLITAGFSVVAPCPHQAPCPIKPGQDWCHFAARVARSSVHRQIKRAELGYEDEKFAFVAASPDPSPDPGPGRVLRRPRFGKGMVTLTVCTRTDGITTEVISKRQGLRYRAARDLTWGSPWPAPGGEPS